MVFLGIVNSTTHEDTLLNWIDSGFVMTVQAYHASLKNSADEKLFYFLYVSMSVSPDVS